MQNANKSDDFVLDVWVAWALEPDSTSEGCNEKQLPHPWKSRDIGTAGHKTYFLEPAADSFSVASNITAFGLGAEDIISAGVDAEKNAKADNAGAISGMQYKDIFEITVCNLGSGKETIRGFMKNVDECVKNHQRKELKSARIRQITRKNGEYGQIYLTLMELMYGDFKNSLERALMYCPADHEWFSNNNGLKTLFMQHFPLMKKACRYTAITASSDAEKIRDASKYLLCGSISRI